MKNLFLMVLCLFLFGFVACSNTHTKPVSINELNKQIAIELENLDNNYSEETLKALSVVLRNNLTITKNYSTENPTDKYLKIAESTNKKVLKNKNNNLVEISLENNNEYSWQKTIKKSKLLEFAFNNKINLTNLSNIEPIIENEKVTGINIGNKYFDYELLAKEFGLESNIIENIEDNKKEIIIKGKNKGFCSHFDINKSEQLSNNNHNYEQILNLIFSDLKIN